MKFPLSEYFSGFQGEGKHCGRYCLFIRFSACNFRCSYCDTSDRVGKINFELSVGDILDLIKVGHHRHLVITGGEPCLYPTHLLLLMKALDSKGVFVEVETNGSIQLGSALSRSKKWHFNISPKVWNAAAYRTIVSPQQRVYKFPLSPENYRPTLMFIKKHVIKAEEIYVMPLAKTKSEYERLWMFVYEKAMQHHWNISSRMQVVHGIR